jgi:hypothetical protein
VRCLSQVRRVRNRTRVLVGLVQASLLCKTDGTCTAVNAHAYSCREDWPSETAFATQPLNSPCTGHYCPSTRPFPTRADVFLLSIREFVVALRSPWSIRAMATPDMTMPRWR